MEAVVETSLTATIYNFQRILFLSDCAGLFTTLNSKTTSNWQDSIRLANLNFLVQGGLLYKMILVPSLLVNHISIVAKQATLPLNQR